jgi:anti-sigma regulatory factor (Ser/Thr protein kinase)
MLARAHKQLTTKAWADARRSLDVERLTVVASLQERARTVEFITHKCREAGVPVDCEHDIVSAFGEAFNNVVQHSYGGDEGLVDIEVAVRRDRFLLRLRDTGRGFDPTRVQSPDLDALPEGGMGMFIMLRAMDDVSWYREGTENVVAMSKRLPR